MDIIKKILKSTIRFLFLILIAFALFKGIVAGVWLYDGAKKGHESAKLLNEVYESQAYVLMTFVEYVDTVSKKVDDINNAFVQDITSTRKMIQELQSTNKEVTNNVTTDLKKLLDLIYAVDSNSLGRDKEIVSNINNALKKPSYDYLASMTVLIMNPDNFNPEMGALGTGVIVKIDKEYTYILTNNHVCSAKTETDCRIIDAKSEYILEPYKYTSTEYDVSLLRVRGKIPNTNAIRGIASARPQDAVFLVGHHLGRPFIYGEGVFAGYDGQDEVIQVPTFYGNSGSGVFNREAQLVGLVYSIKGANALQLDVAHGQIVPAHILKAFLGDLINE